VTIEKYRILGRERLEFWKCPELERGKLNRTMGKLNEIDKINSVAGKVKLI